MNDSPLMKALRSLEAVEANLVKLERLWGEIEALIPSGIVFGDNPEYEDRCRSLLNVLSMLPPIDGWKPEIDPPDLNQIAQNRLDAADIGEPYLQVQTELAASLPGRDIREYRFRLNQKRRELIRDALADLVERIDGDIRALRDELEEREPRGPVSGPRWAAIRSNVDQVDALLGSSVNRPPRWSDLRRHLHFGQVADFKDIDRMDWPSVKLGLQKGLYGENEPIPVGVEDLSDLVSSKPSGPVTTQLNWENLGPVDFERLIYSLISAEEGYENPEWLMKTNAPDRGRDLSVVRVVSDALSGMSRLRVVIQCKHWLDRSVSVADVSEVKEQMSLWGEPRVGVLVIATSGRFTADAVAWIERHNSSDSALRIEMWPESHLERLLASRPALIAEFQLR